MIVKRKTEMIGVILSTYPSSYFVFFSSSVI